MAGYKHLEIPGNFERYVKDKKQSANAYYRYFLARLSRMFEYKGLPDTIPHEILDRYLMNNGIACITEVDGKLYVFFGNMGGPQDVYYRPTEFIISNPHIKVNGELFTANIPIYNRYQDTEKVPGVELGQPKGCLIRNDSEWIGLAPLLSRYSYLMAENTLTLRTADVMLRIVAMITAPSDKERASALEYLKSMENGILSVIGESAFFDGVKLQSPPSNNGSYLTQFIEYQQYLKGSLYNEIGLSANYNMKREAIGKGESTLDQDALLPLADNMLLTRKQDLALVNEMFGTEIEVSFSSAWLENELEALNTIASFGSTQNGNPFNPMSPISPSSPDGSTQPTEDSETPEEVPMAQEGAEGAEGEESAEGAKGAEELPVDAGDDDVDNSDADNSDADNSDIEQEDTEQDSESANNDISWSDTLQQAKENLEEKVEKGDEVDVEPVPMGNEETEDDAGDNSAD